MKPICLSKEIKKEKVNNLSYGNYYFTRDSTSTLKLVPRACPHLALDTKTCSVKDKNWVCPYHGWKFDFVDPNELNLFEYRGVVWDYNNASVNTLEVEDILQRINPKHWRKFKIKANYRHVLANLVDTAHFQIVHSGSPGMGLHNYKIEPLNKNQIQCSWQTSLPRPTTSLVSLYDYCVTSRVPFFNDWLTAVNLVIPSPTSSFESTLLVNFFFNREEHQNSPWLRFWTNRMVDVLVWEDTKILEQIIELNPKLERETNPLILGIYNDIIP